MLMPQVCVGDTPLPPLPGQSHSSSPSLPLAQVAALETSLSDGKQFFIAPSAKSLAYIKWFDLTMTSDRPPSL